MGAFQPSHILIVVLVLVLLFAAPKLPQLARNLGESMRVFKSEVKEMNKDGEKTDAAGTEKTIIVDEKPTDPTAK